MMRSLKFLDLSFDLFDRFLAQLRWTKNFVVWIYPQEHELCGRSQPLNS